MFPPPPQSRIEGLLVSLLDFESAELETLRRQATREGVGEDGLNAAMDRRIAEMYQQLTPWQKVQVARHRERPYTLDYLQWAFTDFVELHGDRRYADDRAVVGGPASLDGRSVMVICHQKGRDNR